MSKENGADPDRKTTRGNYSRIDSAYLIGRTEMFQGLNMAGYHQIGTGDPTKVPVRAKTKTKTKTKRQPKTKPKAGPKR